MFDFKEVEAVVDCHLITVFNEDEIISVEILDDEYVTAAVDWYASLGYGVAIEVAS